MSRAKKDRAAARRTALRRLHRLYAQIPAIACKGLCHDTCVEQIDMSDTERDQLARRRVTIPPVPPGALHAMAEPTDCPALTADRRCSVYEDRPLICRLWGVAESLPCPHGCQPGRILPDDEAFTLIRRSVQAGGGNQVYRHTPPAGS